jgi:uncharacterized OsmC-like protein
VNVAEGFEVAVGAGTLRSPSSSVPTMPHRWTREGVTVEAAFTGAHLLHLAVAGCVLNDVYREAETLGVVVDGARVHARGGYDTGTWSSTGIEYTVEVDSPATPDDVARLVDAVDRVAEIPRAVRTGTQVRRVASLS